MKNLLFISFILCIPILSFAQPPRISNTASLRPRLVVGLVIDQMRWDYLYKYNHRFGKSGFKRLIGEGYNCENTFIPYLPTVTAPGHTSIYTGSVPAIHGIIGNYWYDRINKKTVYCTDDTTTTIGSNSKAGKMSPNKLWSSTITDELKLATNGRSKVIGIALKDRGAILPAGHAANAAYWFDDANGSFITSSYYQMKELPAWLQKFNDRRLPDKYMKENWTTLYPIDTYTQSAADTNSYEDILESEDNSFPHTLSTITKNKYQVLESTPAGLSLTVEMAKAAIVGEELGKRENNTDFLALSVSSTDYAGHKFGPNSVEIEDMYLRLDSELGSFLTFLDRTIGPDNYTLFLTADHGIAHIVSYLNNEMHLPAGTANIDSIKTVLNEVLGQKLKIEKGIEKISNFQVFLSRNIPEGEVQKVKNLVINTLMQFPFVANAVDLSNVANATITETQKKMIINGYNQKLSGDIQFIYKPQWMEGGHKGTSHGGWNPYDAHLPLIWFGWGIAKGHTYREVYMTDIAATLAALLHIQMPNGCIGKVIEEVIKR